MVWWKSGSRQLLLVLEKAGITSVVTNLGLVSEVGVHHLIGDCMFGIYLFSDRIGGLVPVVHLVRPLLSTALWSESKIVHLLNFNWAEVQYCLVW